MGLDINQEAEALERAMGSVDLTTTDKLHGKIGTDTELADRSLFDILTGDGPASFPNAAVPANDVSLAEVLRSVWGGLWGTAAGENGVATFPASAAPANNVSIAEVLRSVYDNVSGTDGATNFIGADNSNNSVATTNIAANRDGSILERQEFDHQQSDKTIVNTAATLVNGTTIFTIANGPISILGLMAYCVTANDGTASTLQWSHDPTDGAATTISGASASLANAAAGATVTLLGTALSTAPTVTANGAVLGQTREIILMPGILTTTVGVGSTTGTWTHHLRYRPLSPTSVVS